MSSNSEWPAASFGGPSAVAAPGPDAPTADLQPPAEPAHAPAAPMPAPPEVQAVPQPAVQQYEPSPVIDRPRLLSTGTAETRVTIVGSLIASASFVWLLYYRVLPWSGIVGYVICVYFAYLFTFAAVTSMNNPLPVVKDRLVSAVVSGAALLVFAALGTTIVYTFVKGYKAADHINFFTHSQAGTSPTAPFNQGGILNAIVGSLIELGIATAISLPLGIGTAVFMVEVGGRWSRVVRTVVEAMTALPDIIAGLFIYAVYILAFGFPRSGLAAGLALAVMMLPIIARTSDVALRVVPNGLREAGYALGAGQWQTIWRVVLPTCRSGLATAVILGMARAVGETAPVLITSGASTYFVANPLKEPMNSLPLYIITALRSGEPAFITRGFGAAIVLLVIVLILFGTARFLSRSKQSSR